MEIRHLRPRRERRVDRKLKPGRRREARHKAQPVLFGALTSQHSPDGDAGFTRFRVTGLLFRLATAARCRRCLAATGSAGGVCRPEFAKTLRGNNRFGDSHDRGRAAPPVGHVEPKNFRRIEGKLGRPDARTPGPSQPLSRAETAAGGPTLLARRTAAGARLAGIPFARLCRPYHEPRRNGERHAADHEHKPGGGCGRDEPLMGTNNSHNSRRLPRGGDTIEVANALPRQYDACCTKTARQ